ncbi:hypothetical protein [Tateyamaria omphalii]|uniref:hypothetical protein n=1 Tax=Tateyamaria omphalii TaxID=299262 RepID=UPI0016761CB9|nr:hypothetical protein [Tateyamaria omphalii]
MTIKRKATEFDALLTLEAYTKRLLDFPKDCVHHALLVKTWKFWPAWSELADVIAPLVAFRNDALHAVQNPGPPQIEAPDRRPCGKDRASEIMQEAGFTAKRIADIQAAPPTVAPSDIDAGAGHTASQRVPYSARRHPDDIRISRLRNPIMRESMGLTEAQAQAEIDAILNGKSQEDAA